MKGITLSLQIDLTIHLGLIALVITIVLWRLSNTGELLRRSNLLDEFRKRTFLTPRASCQYLMLKCQQVWRFFIVIYAFILIKLSFDYISVLERIFGPDSSKLDMAIIRYLWYMAEDITTRARGWSGIVAAFLLVDYLTAMLEEAWFSSVAECDMPLYAHSYIMPKRWRLCFEGLWCQRIRQVTIHLISYSDFKGDIREVVEGFSWKTDWTEWARFATAYGIIARQNERSAVAS